MSAEESITRWIRDLQAGHATAVQKVWEHFYSRLVERCRKMLPGHHRRSADEEDAVLSAFDSFYRGLQNGRFPMLRDRRDLWQVLLMVARRKVIDQLEREGRQKRGSGQVRGGPVFAAAEGSAAADGIAQAVSDEPTPELAAIVAEQYARLMDRLPDETTRNVAQWKLEGYADHEIAGRLTCSLRTVQRKLWLIRRKWSDEVDDA